MMDRKEAADLLDNLIGMVEDNHGADYDTALKMGIEALSTSGDGPEPVDDTISRQAAIDALMAWEEGSVWNEECLKHRGEPYWVAPSDVIEQLPSAQPEPHYDEWCTDCKEYDTDKHCCPRWNRVIRQTLKDAQPEQQWIPVVKKPIEKGLMLVTYNDGDVDLLKQPTAYRRSDIVAWMPIEPWKGEQDG